MVKIVLSEKLKFKIVALISLVSFLAVVYGLFALARISDTVRTAKKKVAETQRDVAVLDGIVKDMSTYDADIKRIGSSFPSSVYDISYFAGQLERLASVNNLDLAIKFSREKTQEKLPYDSISMLLTIDGKYSDLSKFLSDISKLPYHTQIIRLDVEGENEVVSGKVNMKIFIKK